MDHMRMEEDQDLCITKILDLTLEIIYLLTGEDFEMAKKTCVERLSYYQCGMSPTSVPPPYFLKPEVKYKQNILEVTKKMMELLTGESVCVFPTDGSSNGNPPERCPRPLYSRDSTQEHINYAHNYEGKDVVDLKVQVKAEEMSHQSMEKGEMKVPIKEKESFHVMMENQPPLTSLDGSSNGNPPERCPLYSIQEDHNYARCYQVGWSI
ncbi:hypothetical protein AB205_0189970 [Aquarana catesbeiana]|uniref:Uncharacterized protein n=1 Tax=Aquarana catesbeiana TaxID=8400 RepID=A0A2G9Q2T6_AQUCT|nr:hypothetical protein AB205_0189970 [Aquarana catesbeiana]